MTGQQRRIRRIKNRIARTRLRLRACEQGRLDPARHQTLRALARLCDAPGRDFDAVVDDVADRLDEIIEPRNPLWEWVSDLGVDVVAFAAVAIWRDTEARLRRRLTKDEITLTRLQGGL